MNAIKIEKAKDKIIEIARGIDIGVNVFQEKRIQDLKRAITELDNLFKKQSLEVEDIALEMGIDLNSESVPKEYPMPNYKDDATKFILSKEFKEKGELIRKFLGEFLPIPEVSTLIVGKNRIGKTPVLKYWKEYLENRIMDIEREELIQTEQTNSYVRLDAERKKYSSIYKTELDIFDSFKQGIPIDYSTRTGYLFLDDIFQESIWDEKNYNHEGWITFMTKFYQKLRDNYFGNLIVIATTNILPTSDALDNNTRIQSRVLGTFKKIINIEESK
jgi:hypothetical protein